VEIASTGHIWEITSTIRSAIIDAHLTDLISTDPLVYFGSTSHYGRMSIHA